MEDIAGILLVLLAIILMIRLKVGVGKTIALGALMFGIIFGMSLADVAHTFLDAADDFETLELVAIIILINVLGNILRFSERLDDISDGLRHVVKDIRVRLFAIPAFIGLLPMPGGALLSAPLTEKVAEGADISAETKSVINYWFRHIWEYTFPLYPGVIFSSAIFGITYGQIIASNGLLNITAVVVGFLLIVYNMKERAGKRSKNVRKHLTKLAYAIMPVATVISAHLLLGVNLIACLAAVNLVLAAHNGFYKKFGKKTAVESLKPQMIFLVFAIMGFKKIIEASGAVDSVAQSLNANHIPVSLVLFFVPFMVGALTGMTIAYVGVTFPILSQVISHSGFSYSSFMLAYSGGYMGVMLSPVHLCLVLTVDYFKADLGKVYRKIVPIVAVMTAAAFALYISGVPDMLA